jgi:hypothetical protein
MLYKYNLQGKNKYYFNKLNMKGIRCVMLFENKELHIVWRFPASKKEKGDEIIRCLRTNSEVLPLSVLQNKDYIFEKTRFEDKEIYREFKV